MWISREAFMSLVIPAQADAALLEDNFDCSHRT